MNQGDTFFALQTAVAGRYSLVRELGRGGMGIVYLARDVALDRPVAIKMLPPSLTENAELRERFVREARTVAQLSHPNIVPIHAVEERDGLVFFVMSYVDGETLGDRVRRAGPLTPAEATRVMQEVAWALGHAHARGIIHRDVKPDNVLLDAESGRAIVTDFGIAASRTKTTTGENILGTPQYLSPEQARGESVEPRSDVYSLGATMWFALTGSPPFTGTMPQLLHRHGTEAAPPLTSVRATVPASLARAIDRCLSKSAADRPASADALAVELGQSAALAPVIPAAVREYLRNVSGTEVQQYAIAGMLTTATMVVLNNLPVGNELFNTNSIIATISGFASAACFAVSGALLAVRGQRVRELTRAGFDYRAVRRAVDQERVRFAAEMAPPSRVQAMKIAVAGAIITIGGATLAIGAQSYPVGFLWATTAMVSGLLTVRGVVDSGIARGPGVRGRLFQAIEGWMFRHLAIKNAPRAVTDGEATVVALGGAIQNLWQQLSDSARAALTDVPRVAALLEDEAVRLRASSESAAAARLQTVVAAMESLRLDLLRVQDGTLEASALTAQIDAAKQVGAHVDAMIEARDEVRALLKSDTPRVLT